MSPLTPEAGDVAAQLDRIRSGLERLGRARAIALLQPGVPPARVQEVLSELALTPPPGVPAMYEWANGSDTSAAATLDDLYLIPGYYFLSLEDAAAEYRARVGPGWDAAWLPVFADGGGGFFAVICDPDAGELGHVLGLDGDGFPPATAFSSVANMASTFAQAYDDGLIEVRDGYLEWDDAEFARLAARINSEAEYWQE